MIRGPDRGHRQRGRRASRKYNEEDETYNDYYEDFVIKKHVLLCCKIFLKVSGVGIERKEDQELIYHLGMNTSTPSQLSTRPSLVFLPYTERSSSLLNIFAE